MASYFLLKSLVKSPIWLWDWTEVEKCSADELEALCMLWGCPRSGTKSEKIERLKIISEVRLFLNRESLESLQEKPKKLLAEYARKTGTPAYLNKYGIAAGLLNWRSRCIARSKEFLEENRQHFKSKPTKQLVLPLF